jgi:hypothetical protein
VEDFVPGMIVGLLFGSTTTGWLLPRLVTREIERRMAKRMHPSNFARLPRPTGKPDDGRIIPFPNQREAE